MQLMVMGVSGSGKTSLGEALATRLHATFVDSDDLHPQRNIEKMRRGEPLGDADREPWLQRICARLTAARGEHERLVLACSALKLCYRQRFLAVAPGLTFVYLKADRTIVAKRLAHRSAHFMSPALLDSQINTLEEPRTGEPVVILDAAEGLAEALRTVMARLPCTLSG